MKTKYAVIDSAYYTSGLITSAYHYLAYESICGYSLGGGITFYESLDTAKNIAYPPAQSELSADDADKRKCRAVISFNCDDDESHIINVDQIYTVRDVREEYHRLNIAGNPSVKVYVPTWDVKIIKESEVTLGALAAFRKAYDLRFYKQNPGNFWRYFVTESWLPAEKKYRASVETGICEKLDMLFEEEHKLERAFTHEIPSLFTIITGVSCLFTAGNFRYIASAAEAVNPDLSNGLKILTLMGTLLTLSGLGAQAYREKLNEDKRAFVRHGLFTPQNQKQIRDASSLHEDVQAPRFK